MLNITNINLILNLILIIYLIYSKCKYGVYFKSDRTFIYKTLLGYNISFYKKIKKQNIVYYENEFNFYIPIRNKRKVMFKESFNVLSKSTKENQIKQLTTLFSWLNTIEEVELFYKKYSILNKELLDSLVVKFKEKNKNVKN